jgi:hypothetical protein
LQAVSGLGRQFGAQTANVNVYRPFAALEVNAPDQVEQAVTPEEFAPMRDQESQRIVLAGVRGRGRRVLSRARLPSEIVQ